MKPFDYTSAGNYTRQVDLSMAGQAQDCAECHVGGGAMEYVPNPVMDNRVPLRNLYTVGDVNGFGSISNANYTAFNYFIDTYDVNNDGNRTMVLEMDWAENGVMEMDCFLCHLKGYDYDVRTAMLRDAKFDASRAVGAGVAAPNTADWDGNSSAGSGYGTLVTYNSLVDQPVSGNATFSSDILMNIKASPPSENCAFCHFDFPGVDWKKRGDNWKREADAHWVLQCMGCHQGKVGSAIGTSGDALSSDLGQCDPTKGHEPYSGLQNNKDDSIKTCEDCHLRAGYDSGLDEYSPDYGAPDPTGKHMAYGLLGEICQDGTDGVADASHLDVVHCTACHVRKIADEAWNTGGAVVDATGEDEEHRLADHENDYVLRSVKENLAYQWRDGKVVPTGVLTTIFWRDKHDSWDANNDSRGGAMDPPLMTHVLAINEGQGWTNMSHDYAGNITAAHVATRIAQIETDLPGLIGASDNASIKLCALAVPFVVTHNVSPAIDALGHSCSDCHNASSQGLWNDTYNLKGDAMTLKYYSGNATLYTAVNKVTPTVTPPGTHNNPTDVHPKLKNKLNNRSIPLQPLSGGTELTGLDRSEFLWEDASASGDNITKVSGGNCTTRTAWVSYLNTIPPTVRSYPDANITSVNGTGPTPHGYGLGCNVTSSFCDAQGYGIDNNSTDGCNCTMILPMYGCEIFDTLKFTAHDVGAGATYMWNFNDGTGQQTGNPVWHTFNSLGVYKVILTVVDAYGIADPEMIEVNVTRP